MVRHGLFVLFVAAAAAAGVAHAQSKKGPNGGTVVVSDHHPIEFVLKGEELTFYMGDDDGSPLPTTEVRRARATIQEGGNTTTVSLAPSPPNKLTGKAKGAVGSKARVVFSATLHGHTLTARYVTE
jgi:hypothetical protein